MRPNLTQILNYTVRVRNSADSEASMLVVKLREREKTRSIRFDEAQRAGYRGRNCSVRRRYEKVLRYQSQCIRDSGAI